MIALHLRDSPAHIIAPSQRTGPGDSGWLRRIILSRPRSPALFKTVTINLRDLYRVRCYSLVDVVHNKYKGEHCQQFL